MTQQMDGELSMWTGTLMLAQDTAAQPVIKAAEPVPVGVSGATGTAQPGGTTAAPTTTTARPAPSGADMLWPFIVMAVVIVLMTTLTGRKERKKRQELMNSLKKHDKVLTTGGVIGTVVELSDTEVVLRVEDGRIRFSRSAVANIINSSEVASEKPSIAGAA